MNFKSWKKLKFIIIHDCCKNLTKKRLSDFSVFDGFYNSSSFPAAMYENTHNIE